MRKRDLINNYKIMSRGVRRLSTEESRDHIDGVLHTIAFNLMYGEDVAIGDFGTFKVVTDKKGKRTVEFKPCKQLRDAMNNIHDRFHQNPTNV